MFTKFMARIVPCAGDTKDDFSRLLMFVISEGCQSMIRSELVKKLESENTELKTEEVERIVDLFFNQMIQRLADGGRVELRGFGAFSTRERNPRKGRNPRTGASVDVPPKRVPYFKPGKEVRERLNH